MATVQIPMSNSDKWESLLKPVLSDFSGDYWRKVQTKFEESQKTDHALSWRRTMDEVRVDILTEKKLDDKDPLYFLLKHAPQHYEQQVNRIASVFFERDRTDKKYEKFDDELSQKTLLHVAAERNFVIIAQQLMKYYPESDLLWIACPYKLECNGKQKDCIPLELALDKRHDGVAAYLIKEIIERSHPERVRELFECDEGDSESCWRFADLITDKRMQDTVVEILNCLVKPDWPYLPDEPGEPNKPFENERSKAWTSITDDPTKYHFYYQIIDGDQGGRPPRSCSQFWSLSKASYQDKDNFPKAPKNIQGTCNPACNKWERSCLQLLAESNNKCDFTNRGHPNCDRSSEIYQIIKRTSSKETFTLKILSDTKAIQHPVVRNLVKRKWSLYGKKVVSYYTGLYVFFLFCLSFALWEAASVPDPLKYGDDAAEFIRAVCEACVFLMLMFYVVEEFYQLIRDRCAYWYDKYNYFDIFGVLLAFAVIPLRLVGQNEQWVIASLAYCLNVLRIFKFSCLFEVTAMYTNTLAIVIRKDIPRFLAVFSIVLLALSGSYFFALHWVNKAVALGNFLDFIVIGIRTLTEQEGFYDSHYKWFSLVLGQFFMFAIIVIMLNLLIAQLSDTYSNCKSRARVQADMDRILVITRLEYSFFKRFNNRVQYYVPGDWSYDVDYIRELIKDWQEESSDEKIEFIKNILVEKEKRLKDGSLTKEEMQSMFEDMFRSIQTRLHTLV